MSQVQQVHRKKVPNNAQLKRKTICDLLFLSWPLLLQEFDVADALLRAVGEGQQMDVLREDQAEILPDGTFPATAIWRRKQRPECKPYRKRVLGY